MKKFATEIYEAVKLKELKEPFSAADVRRACPGWAYGTYSTFLWKHMVGNSKTTELFEQVGQGLYRTLPNQSQT